MNYKVIKLNKDSMLAQLIGGEKDYTKQDDEKETALADKVNVDKKREGALPAKRHDEESGESPSVSQKIHMYDLNNNYVAYEC